MELEGNKRKSPWGDFSAEKYDEWSRREEGAESKVGREWQRRVLEHEDPECAQIEEALEADVSCQR